MSQTQLEQQNNQNNEIVQTNISTQQIPGGLRGHTAYLNPEDNYIYVSQNRGQPEFYSENKVSHAPTLRKAMAEISQHGRLVSEDFDKVELYTSKFQATAEDYWKHIAKIASIGRTAAVGGMMVPENFSAINITNVLAQLRGTEERNYVLQDAVTNLNTSLLEGRIDIEAGFDVHKNIPLGAEIPSNQVTYTSVTFKLPMLGAHVARYNEMNFTNLEHDPYRNSINRIGKRVIKAKAELVKDAITAATVTSAGSSWIAFTGGDSNANPYVDIGTASDAIVAANGNPDTIVLNDRTFRSFFSNSWVRGATEATKGNSPQPGVTKSVAFPGTGLTAYVDSLISNNEVYIYDKEAIIGFQGPSAVTTYEDPHHRAEGYYYWEYFYAKIIENSKIYKLTGIAP
jgi:hypothetical protein